MEYIIDFNGFIMPDGVLVVKEICVVNIRSQNCVNNVYGCEHYVFQPPAKYIDTLITRESQDQNGNKHGILWDYGASPYELFEEKLKTWMQKASYFYVLGPQMRMWLEKLIDNAVPIIDIEQMRFFSIDYVDDFQKVRCPFRQFHSRRRQYGCAFQTVQQLKHWFLEYWGYKPSYEKSVQLFYQLGDLSKMDSSDITCLDDHFILKFAKRQISHVWDKLPIHLQNNERIVDYKRCIKHHKDGCDDWDISGIYMYPYQKDCPTCNLNK